jgi:hypothetical protein
VNFVAARRDSSRPYGARIVLSINTARISGPMATARILARM